MWIGLVITYGTGWPHNTGCTKTVQIQIYCFLKKKFWPSVTRWKCQLQVPPTVYFIKRLKIIPCNRYVRTYFLSEVHVYLQNVQYLIWTICNHILLIVRGINELSLKAIKVKQSRWMPWIIKEWRAKWSRVTNWMLMQRWRSVILPALIKNKRMAQWSSWPRSTRHNYDFH